MDSEALREVVDELWPLEGARLQRVDVVDEREMVFELRVPGATLRLVASARAGFERVHLLDKRPDRKLPHGPLQAFLRQRLIGQRVSSMETRGRSFVLRFERDRLTLNLQGGKRALQVEAIPSEVGPARWAGTHVFPVNDSVKASVEREAPEAEADRLRKVILRSLTSKLSKMKRLEKNLLGDLAKLEKYGELQHQGELLKTVFGQIARGQAEVEVYDWLGGKNTVVMLDPTKSPQQNLQAFFDRAKKAERGKPIVERRLEDLWAKIEATDSRKSSVQEASYAELLSWMEQAEGGQGSGLSTSVVQRQSHPIDQVARRFKSTDGTEIFVGRGAKANDQLTFRFSKGTDLWLHARGTTGAHVLLKVQPGKSSSEEALLDAATLAAHYSPQKGEAKVEIMIAESRFVSKTKGAAPGLVGVSKSRTMLLQMDPKRLDRLFGR